MEKGVRCKAYLYGEGGISEMIGGTIESFDNYVVTFKDAVLFNKIPGDPKPDREANHNEVTVPLTSIRYLIKE